MFVNGKVPFQSTLLMRGATWPIISIGNFSDAFQSTLPMRGATGLHFVKVGDIAFQSTLPIRGATLHEFLDLMVKRFQSTLLIRGATVSPLWRRLSWSNFNPRSSYEERLHSLEHGYADYTFQSTLLMRGATRTMSPFEPASRFQSTLLMRGATSYRVAAGKSRRNFNPRSSCEERRETRR